MCFCSFSVILNGFKGILQKLHTYGIFQSCSNLHDPLAGPITGEILVRYKNAQPITSGYLLYVIAIASLRLASFTF